MLLTKYKVRELIDGIELDVKELEEYSGIKLDDDSAILVGNAIEMFKDKITDKIEERKQCTTD
nr:MAG TPA: hypothetical protein [Caudoviricetes sp.]